MFLNNEDKRYAQWLYFIKPKFVFISKERGVLILFEKDNCLQMNKTFYLWKYFANRINTCDMINVYRPPAGKIGQIVKETFSSVTWMQLSKIKGFLAFSFACSLSTFWLTIGDIHALDIIFSIDSQQLTRRILFLHYFVRFYVIFPTQIVIR